jgi:hypothetical protein
MRLFPVNISMTERDRTSAALRYNMDHHAAVLWCFVCLSQLCSIWLERLVTLF